MKWAAKRKSAYIIIFCLIIGTPLAVVLFTMLHKAPTCFDGVQNQGEDTIDKGGPCILLDEASLTPYTISWARALSVRTPTANGGGIYNAVAYIENPNKNAWVKEVPYRFRLYDAENILVGEREGVVTILPQATTPVFEGGIQSGSRVATRAFFEITAPLVWERTAPPYPDVVVGNSVLTADSETTRVVTPVENIGSQTYEHVGFVAVIFDTTGNAFAASKTIRDRIGRKEQVDLTFTWPSVFKKAAGRIDVFPVMVQKPL